MHPHTAIVGVALMAHVIGGWTCPTQAVNDVLICLSNLTSGIHEEGKKLGEDSHIIKQHCKTGEFRSAIACVERIFHDCRHRKDLLFLLKQLADPDSIRKAFRELCANLDLYMESSGCMMKQDSRITPCYKQIEETFNVSIYLSKTVNEEINSFCGFQNGIRGCIIEPVHVYCGQAIVDLLNTFMKGVTSPVCIERASEGFRFKPLIFLILLSSCMLILFQT
ncbi:uncharacterized protein [Haliotis asinina]|uniref:uncharacterized protein isoform X2 n=1 Tax=Haliotis asinina TaxID=109174 RepID=UPI003531D687